MKHINGRFVSEKTTLERFTEKYVIDPITGCWLWTARIHKHGYGQFYLNGSMRSAPRVSYQLHVGPIPCGLDLDHTCHNRSNCLGGDNCIHRRCVNWKHLEAVSRATNTKRSSNTIAAKNMMATHCPQGHAYDDINTQFQTYLSKGHRKVVARVCITCKRDYYQRRYKRSAA